MIHPLIILREKIFLTLHLVARTKICECFSAHFSAFKIFMRRLLRVMRKLDQNANRLTISKTDQSASCLTLPAEPPPASIGYLYIFSILIGALIQIQVTVFIRE